MKFVLVFVFVIVLFCGNCMSSEQSHKRCPIAECINSGNGHLSSAIICNSCTVKIMSNKNAAFLLREAQRTAHNYIRTRLADVNADILFLIFNEFLDTTSMINLLNAYPAATLSSVARDCFRRRYKGYTVHLTNDTQSGISVNDESKFVVVSMKKAAKILRMFGTVMQHLKVEHPSTIVSQYINEFTSGSLIKFDMFSIENDTFEYFTNSFQAVNELIIREKVIGAHLPFNQIFPNIQRLELENNRSIPMNFIHCEFSLLKSAKINLWRMSGDEGMIDAFYLKNRQIRSLEVIFLTEHLCKILNNHLQNMGNLTIRTHDFRIANETTMKHVKHFRIVRAHLDFEPRNLKLLFPHLQSLKIGYAKLFSIVWIDFCRKHRNVQYLEIHGVYKDPVSVFQNQLNQVISELPNLIEITLIHGNYVNYPLNHEIISQIIDTHQKLKRLNLLSFYFSENDLYQLRQQFPHWNIITKIQQNSIRALELKLVDLWFEKKN